MATKYGGYMGKVMMIDLTTGQTSEYPWSDEERRLFIGGKIMAAKILGDNLKSDTQPLSEENMLVITTGPFTGSGAPSSSRFNVSTLSPQTGILTSSNCGGNFGYYLKKAGLDALIIKGRSPEPVWLEICNDNFTLHDASDIWGMHTGRVQEVLEDKLRGQSGRAPKNGKSSSDLPVKTWCAMLPSSATKDLRDAAAPVQSWDGRTLRLSLFPATARLSCTTLKKSGKSIRAGLNI